MREQGFEGPIAVIPHGAWIPKADRQGTRHSLGVEESTPLVGAFGYLKPYKRIAESLRALRRLVKLDRRVRMILVGEPHPEFPVKQIVRTLGLEEYVRVLGFAPIDKFVDYMDACDIVLNLRNPTVGETSGSLQRALGLGKAVIVSDIGAFAELPDDICLKVSTGPDEEDLIFEYLNLLVSRPDLRRAMGNRARQWAERECSWSVVAGRYTDFLSQFAGGRTPPRDWQSASVASEPATPPAQFVESVTPAAIESWVAPDARQYAAQHTSRFVRTLGMIPAGDASKSIL
jgi:glycosyltransferase involved in cell wall biosynthesis